MDATVHRLPADDYAGKLEAVLAYGSQIEPLQQVFGSSVADPQLLGFEVGWRLALVQRSRKGLSIRGVGDDLLARLLFVLSASELCVCGDVCPILVFLGDGCLPGPQVGLCARKR